jgi:FemAB family protein
MKQFDNLLSLFRENKICFELRYDNPSLWDKTYNSLDYQPVEYSSSMIDLHILNMKTSYEDAKDLSMIIHSGGRAIALWVLSSHIEKNLYQLTSTYDAIFRPIFLNNSSLKEQKRFSNAAIKSILELQTISNTNNIKFQENLHNGDANIHLDAWHKELLNAGMQVNLKHDLYIDLSMTIEKIRSHYRKSYKPFINKGLSEWKYEVLTSKTIHINDWNNFRELHKKEAGKITRDPSTWELQYKKILSNDAFLVKLENDLGGLIGCAYFQYSRDECIYSVAAYNRSMFDKPVGHVIQQLAIEHMKKINLSWYRIGNKFFPKDGATDKEINISKFKEGFASKLIPRFELYMTDKND